MKTKGIITDITPSKRGLGIITTPNNQRIHFEKSECDYDFINVGDEVDFDMVKSFDGELDALNINLIRNKVATELDHIFQKQTQIRCKVLKESNQGFIIIYKDIQIYLTLRDDVSQEILIGGEVDVYVIAFHYGGNIIASLSRKNTYDAINYFSIPYKENLSLEFEVHTIYDYGVLLTKDDYWGFMPYHHFTPINQEFTIGQKIFVKIIGLSASKGVILSARNHYLVTQLSELSESFKNQELLEGKIIELRKKYYLVDYQGLLLYLNINYLIDKNPILGSNIKFKVIDFSLYREISISNLEASPFGIFNRFKDSNMFIGLVKGVVDKGIIVSLNEVYSNIFLPFKEISNILPWNYDYESIKLGAKIKISIIKFDFKRLTISRLNYKLKERRNKACIHYSLNQKVALKIYEKMETYGIFVKNHDSKGLIHISEIIPIEIYEQIHKLTFIKFCGNIFKRGMTIYCTVSDIDEVNNKINFDLDYTIQENIERKDTIISFFSDSTQYKDMLIAFYQNKLMVIEKDFLNLS